jgi:hypothetical protein
MNAIYKDDQGVSEPLSLQVYSNRLGLGSTQIVPFIHAGTCTFHSNRFRAHASHSIYSH